MIRQSNLLVLGLVVVAVFCFLIAEPSADPLDNWHWRHPLPQGERLTGVAYGNGTFVIVGEFGTILTSGDGQDWKLRSLEAIDHLRGIAFGNGLFVAVGDGGAVLTSSEGMTWTRRGAGTSDTLLGIVFGNGTFVAVGDRGTVVRSSDGVQWHAGSAGRTDWLQGVTYGDGLFVAVGYAGDPRGDNSSATIFTSPDGIDWQSRSPGIVYPLYGVAYGKGTFIAVGFLGQVLTSPNGETWVERDSKVGNNLNAIVYGNDIFVAVAWGAILTSSDGITWESQTNDWLTAVVWGDDKFVAVGNYDVILTSPDGLSWTGGRNSGDRTLLMGVTYGNEQFVAVGVDGTVLISSDGVEWKKNYCGMITTLVDVTYGNGLFVAVSNDHNPGVFTSPDGVNWTKRYFGSGEIGHISPFKAVTYGGGTFVAVGWPRDGKAGILTSTDGVEWVESEMEGAGFLYGVAYGNGIFVAVGDRIILTSTDGIGWTKRAETYASKIVYGNGTFVAMGNNILTSSDGVSWTTRMSTKSFWEYGLAYGGDTFVLVGYLRKAPNVGKILTSQDGAKWTPRLQADSFFLRAATYGGGSFVVVGFNGVILQSDHVAGSRIAVDMPSIDFAGVPMASVAERAVRIRNEGTEDLLVGNTGFMTPPFSIISDNCSGIAITPGGECSITFGFSSLSIGTFSQSLNISSNDPDRPNVALNLTGTSVAPDLKGEWGDVTYACTSKCKITGALSIEDVGNLDAPSSIVKFYLSDNGVDYSEVGFLKQVSTGTIKAGTSKTKKLSYSFPSGKSASGKYIIAVIDAYNTVMEANESNNKAIYGPIP